MYTTQFYNARGKYSSSLYHLRKDYVAYSHCLVAYLTLQCGKNILDKKLMLTLLIFLKQIFGIFVSG